MGIRNEFEVLPFIPSYFFVLSVIGKSKKSTSGNSENQFLVIYW